MKSILTENLDTVLAIAGILSWVLILVCLTVKRVHDKRKPLDIGCSKESHSFNDEMITEIFRQQLNHSFKAISDLLIRERETLLCLIENRYNHQNSRRSMSGTTTATKIDDSEIESNFTKTNMKSRETYMEAAKLAANGLKTDKISEDLKLPKGEVDLIINLINYRKANMPNTRSLQTII